MTDKKTVIKGAAILGATNILVKIIGAVFKIPLARLLGTGGMGLFSTAYGVYAWVFIISTAGIPVAVSKTVSESYAAGRWGECRKILYVATLLMLITGSGVSFLLWQFAAPLARAMGNPDAAYAFKAISPSVLFLSLTAALRGFFQGRQNMVPTAVSEVMEAAGKLAAGILFASLFAKHGTAYAAAGGMLGVCIGEILGFITLLVIYIKDRKKFFGGVRSQKSSAAGEIVKRLILVAIPVTLGSSVLALANLADTATVMKRLMSAGFTYENALGMWGAYSGFAVPVFNMPLSLLSVVSICVVPAVAGVYTPGRMNERTKQTVLSAMRLTLIFALPCGAGLSIMSAPVLKLLYGGADGAKTLSVLGWAVIPVAMAGVSGAVLQATGYAGVPVRNMLVGTVFKIAANSILVGMPRVNIMGAAIATLICHTVIAVLNIQSLKKRLGISLPARDFGAGPVVSAAVMAAVISYLYGVMPSGGVSTVIRIAAGAITYAAMLFVTGGVKKEDMQLIKIR